VRYLCFSFMLRQLLSVASRRSAPLSSSATSLHRTASASMSAATPAAIAAKLKTPSLYQTQQYINGEFVPAAGNATLAVEDPGTQQVIGVVSNGGVAETEAAISAAAAALPAWRATPLEKRCAVVQKWGELMHEHKDDLATILSMEQGKPFLEARGEVLYAAGFYDFCAKNGPAALAPQVLVPATAKTPTEVRVTREAVGVVGAITPWNFPSAMITRKAAAALAAGCTMVIKPSELTPYSALALGELATQAGVPAGVFNVVVGADAAGMGKVMTESPVVRKITFTGSTRVGKLLMAQSAGTVKRVSLELGGNAPFIVFDDADLDLAVAQATAAKSRNCGQTCVTPNRFIVHASVYDAFAERFAAAMRALKVGYGLAEGSQVGPLINSAAVTKVEEQLKDAVSRGGRVLVGGKRADVGTGSQLFFEPTVIADATKDMLCFREETFGPLAPLFKFSTEEEALALANDTRAGLASYFFSRDEARQERVAAGLEYGMVGVNVGSVSSPAAPFGGMKESGVGREGSLFGFDEYVEVKARHYNLAGKL